MMDRTVFSGMVLLSASLLSVALLAGCAERGEPTTGGPSAETVTDADAHDDPSEDQKERGNDDVGSGSIELETVDKAGYQAVIESHNGNVILVDFWGSWCGPCREGLPHTIEISRKYRDQGLEVVSLAIEYDEEDGPAEARKFLGEIQAGGLQNLLSSEFDIDESFENFGVTGESLPEYHLFDRDGKLVKVFSNDDNADKKTAFTHEDIEAAIRQALGLSEEDANGAE